MARTPNLDTEAKKAAYQAWLSQTSGAEQPPTVFEPGSFAEQNALANAGIFATGSIGAQNAAANGTSYEAKVKAKAQGSALSSDQMTGEGLGAPSAAIMAALKKKPGDRTSAEQYLLKSRLANEQTATKRGGKVQDGISELLIAEEEAPKIGRREATAAVAYNSAADQVLAEAGRSADGRKLDPAATRQGGVAAPAQAVQAESMPTPASTSPRGFAMRMMPDGTVRTTSGVDAQGRSNMQNFGTREAAMAYFRPGEVPASLTQNPGALQPTPLASPAVQPAQPAQPIAAAPRPAPVNQAPVPQSPFSPASDAFLKTGVAPASLDYINGPDTSTKMQSPEAARTTAPTTSLKMDMTSPAKPAPRANLSNVPGSEIFAQMTGASPTPGTPEINFLEGSKEAWSRTTKNSILNAPSMRGAYSSTSQPRIATAQREMVTPRKTGFQVQAEDLIP